jgi:hypothetical protein
MLSGTCRLCSAHLAVIQAALSMSSEGEQDERGSRMIEGVCDDHMTIECCIAYCTAQRANRGQVNAVMGKAPGVMMHVHA